jgi:3-hydroxymyristoyl/3-hydroxydecanoyl-(acyl carrier protein) dehydratase
MRQPWDEPHLAAWRETPLWQPGPATFAVSYGRAAIARILRRIDPDDPVLAGHFPGQPCYPAVLLLEMMIQLGLCLLHFTAAGSPAIGAGPAPRHPGAVQIRRAYFAADGGAVRPGDGLTGLIRLLPVAEASAGTRPAGGRGAHAAPGARVLPVDTATWAAQILKDGTVCAAAVLEMDLDFASCLDDNRSADLPWLRGQ